jgi:predicted RNA-binding protein with EMAP domain
MPALVNLFKAVGRFVSRVSASTGRGLVRMHADRYIKSIATTIKMNNKYIKFSFEDLSHDDKKIFEEMLKTASTFVDKYIDHHDQYHKYRIEHQQLDDVLSSHFDEIMHAGWRTMQARVNSHAYNGVFGKPGSDEEEILKVFFLAINQGFDDFVSQDH